MSPIIFSFYVIASTSIIKECVGLLKNVLDKRTWLSAWNISTTLRGSDNDLI